jgi:hypothetical protein
MPEAISGSHGHNALFRVACVLVNGFAMSDAEAWAVLLDYNERCQPPWNEGELRHKLSEARKVTHQHPRGHLLGSDGKVAPPPPPPRILGRRILKESLRAPLPEAESVATVAKKDPESYKDSETSVATVAKSLKPPPFVDWKARSCPVCWRKWARALCPGGCICTGDVQLGTQRWWKQGTSIYRIST